MTEEFNSIIDVFPMHILEKIVKFVPNHRSAELKLSCKCFYDIFWLNEKDSYRIKITKDIVSNERCFFINFVNF